MDFLIVVGVGVLVVVAAIVWAVKHSATVNRIEDKVDQVVAKVDPSAAKPS